MENRKSKGGAEKARIKKRKALETDADKCAKIGNFFTKSSSRLDTTNEDEETAPQSRKKDPAPSSSHEPTSPEWKQLSVPLSQCWSKSELRNMSSSSVSFWILLITVCSTDGFMSYDIDRCVFNSTESKDIEYTYSQYYNKVEFVRFSSSLDKFVGYTEFGVKQAEYFNNDPAILSNRRTEKERYCMNHVGVYYQAALTKSVEPYVHLYSTKPPSGGHPSMLVCSVYDFYPKTIKVSWFRDGEEVTSDVTSTEEMEDGDWYYQIHSHLEYTPRSGEKISCVVEHASLKEPLRTYWDPSMPESERNKIAIGASGLVLGLVLSLAGFIYYKRKARGRTLVPTTN